LTIESSKNSNISNGFAVIFIILLVVAIGGATFFVFRGKEKFDLNPVIQGLPEAVREALPSPTPSSFPFQEMTIPYLRTREYISSLGEMQKVNENSNFSSFVTNYDSDGFKVYGLLTQPKNSMPDGGFPAIIFLHGYIPPEEYQTTVNYNSYVDYLARNGFVVFKIDLRGHGNSEGESGGGYYSGDYVIDTLNAINALQNTDLVNPDRIGLWGHSMSGNIVMRAFAVKKKIPAVVIWAGAGYTYVDIQEYQIDDDSYRPPPVDSERARKREELRELYGGFDPEHWFWKQVPATNYLDGVAGAIQLNHAVNDNVVSIDYSRNLIRILDGTPIIHELKEYPSGGHNLTGPIFNQAMQNTVEFFKKYL
jgi:dipeptidyl aminopeptidase/acylaminoacyl peptidase